MLAVLVILKVYGRSVELYGDSGASKNRLLIPLCVNLEEVTGIQAEVIEFTHLDILNRRLYPLLSLSFLVL
jgi:hypothetical protein